MLTLTPKLLRQVLADLERHEGYRLYAYPDPLSKLYKANKNLRWGSKPAKLLMPAGTNWSDGNPWTVGIGYTIGTTVDSVQLHDTAVNVTTLEILKCADALARLLPNWLTYPFAVQTVLVNMVYNMGAATLATFKNSLALLKANNWSAAADNLQQSLWYKQTGDRAKELIARVRSLKIEPEHEVA